ncbi:MAG: hypothetical protein WA029_19090 [Anaerolineae bacterium]
MVSLTLGLAGQGVRLELAPTLAPVLLQQDPLANFALDAPIAYTVRLSLAGGAHPAPAPGAEQVVYGADGVDFELAQVTGRLDRRRRLLVAEIRQVEQAADGLRRVLMYLGQLIALDAGGILLRSAGIVLDGRGFACFGPSGAGKTTLMHLALAAQLPVLGDEAVLLMPQGGDWFVHSFPFWEPGVVTRRTQAVLLAAPLAGLLRLVQAPRHALRPLSPGSLLLRLLDTENVPLTTAADSQRWLDICAGLTQQIPGYDLEFRPDQGVWQTLHELTGRY